MSSDMLTNSRPLICYSVRWSHQWHEVLTHELWECIHHGPGIVWGSVWHDDDVHRIRFCSGVRFRSLFIQLRFIMCHTGCRSRNFCIGVETASINRKIFAVLGCYIQCAIFICGLCNRYQRVTSTCMWTILRSLNKAICISHMRYGSEQCVEPTWYLM